MALRFKTNLIYPVQFHPLSRTALFVSKENLVLAEVCESGLVLSVL